MQFMKPSTLRLIRRFASRDADLETVDRPEFVEWHREMRRLYGGQALRDRYLRPDGPGRDPAQEHCPRCGHVGLIPHTQRRSWGAVLITWECKHCGMGSQPRQLQEAAS